ncbi:ribosome biogenesis protein Nop53/GLTSCR2 [Irpex rosettiformis]|uniref:Ribosome biogenesis protein Nop53/GLTSCR2 n=1 Tax=Irpex rosettiformis TaxID=378272 RepID=A0ACB8U2A8_9APHY|nr:ribosome biogenesis protein Nop53/GLTSCR2 [Irpex rosettiformis]
MAKELNIASSLLASGKKNEKSAVGAPSQRTQSSRKGKKAWRKHIDLDAVEQDLEEKRAEERITGSTLQQKTNDELFQVDVIGDEGVRQRQPKVSFSQLTSAKILAQRSAVPAVTTRATSSATLKRKKLSHEEKDRLLRIGKRPRRGPFNVVMDHTVAGEGSAMMEVTEAVKNSGKYDVWQEEGDETEDEIPPPVPHPREHIVLSAVPSPHEGTSYNPPVTAHEELLRSAHEKEEHRVRKAEELSKTKEKIVQARHDALGGANAGVPAGMTVQEIIDEDETEDDLDGVLPTKKVPERKTKKERRKAEKRLAEKRALAEKVAQKRFLASVHAAKSMRKTLSKDVAERERQRLERHQQALHEKLKKGLAGQRLGRHVVPEGEVDVQLGEDLTESFRALKPEGNLFKDRFLSMQQRALIEPRVPVLPTKRKHRIKEYEKHAFKRFDREQA